MGPKLGFATMDLSITQLLRDSITPITLVSGIGLLVLTMTNRYGRIIDRSRSLVREIRAGQAGQGGHHGQEEAILRGELRILLKRANLLKAAVFHSGMTIFFACLMVVALFACALFGVPEPTVRTVVGTMFCVALIYLVLAIVYFIVDLGHSLRALHLEVQTVGEKAEK